jgi:hypothetical protein
MSENERKQGEQPPAGNAAGKADAFRSRNGIDCALIDKNDYALLRAGRPQESILLRRWFG